MSTASAPMPARLPGQSRGEFGTGLAGDLADVLAGRLAGQRRVVSRPRLVPVPDVDRVRPMPGPATTRPRTGRAPRPSAVRSCAIDPRERRLFDARLTRRGRWVVAGALVSLLVLVVGGLALAGQAIVGSVAAGATEPTRTRSVLVQPGQTMWEIAESAAPSADVRATVDEIVELNGLAGAGKLAAGERLRVPVSSPAN